MKVRREINDKVKDGKVVVEMRADEDLYHQMTHQFDFLAKDGEQLNGHNFHLSLSPEKAEELKQKLVSALGKKK